jgi:hypothetical protein
MLKVKSFYTWPQFFRASGSKDKSQNAHSVFNQERCKENQSGEQIRWSRKTSLTAMNQKYMQAGNNELTKMNLIAYEKN